MALVLGSKRTTQLFFTDFAKWCSAELYPLKLGRPACVSHFHLPSIVKILQIIL